MYPRAEQHLQLNYPFDEFGDSPIVGERYRIEKAIGKGGIAAVFLAQDIYTNEPVALKMAAPDDPQCAQAIKDEFHFAMTHRHPALVNPHALLYYKDAPIIVMPYLENPEVNCLEACLSRFRNGDFEHALEKFIAQILEAAAFIHYSGFIYNDFKPANFVIKFPNGEDGSIEPRLFLLDFNLVSRIGAKEPKRGTIHYTAPEVLLGQSAVPQSDLYSVGAMLYELFVGRPPHITDEYSNLIRLITESGKLDLSCIPDKFRNGIGSLLERIPERRPANARDAAKMLGVENDFRVLLESRAGYYLSAGSPPFADELKHSILEYISEKLEKIFLINGLGVNHSELDFLQAEFGTGVYHIERIRKCDSDATVTRIIDGLLTTISCNGIGHSLLLIDDLGGINLPNLLKLRGLIRAPRSIPVVASQKRWKNIDLPCRIFDPLTIHSSQTATREVLKANLKISNVSFNYENIGLATGGDPELIYIRLKEAITSGHLNIFSTEPNLIVDEEGLPDLDAVGKRMYSSLSDIQKSVLRLLSVWGNMASLVILSGFDEKEMNAIDSLVLLGHLRREKDGLSFVSDDARKYIYKQVPETDRPRFHQFWAEIAENHLEESDEFSETIATHWGLSDNISKGYNENLAMARKLFSKGELARAKSYAETSLQLSEQGGGPKSVVLMLCGDILKQEGDYPSARRNYVELLQLMAPENDLALKAEVYNDLGDLSRSLKKPKRALYYARKALQLFGKLNEKQGLANCYNNIGLIKWVEQKYDEALDSFFEALELNKQLGNYRELAKVQSNIGIIKDITGKTSEVAAFFEAALTNARRASDPRLESPFANNLGYFFIRQNELDQARKYLLEALEIAEKIGHIEVIINSLSNLGLCSLKQGRLFESVDYNQKAWQLAESVGNRHLALDAQLYLAEVSILMGNFSLADKVLGSLETDEIYLNNRPFQAQLDLLRSSWRRETGDSTGARDLAQKTHSYALEVGDSQLAIEAELAKCLAIISNMNEAQAGLAHICKQVNEYGDLANSAGLAMVRLCLKQMDFNAARHILEECFVANGASARNRIEKIVLSGECEVGLGRFDQSISTLSEIETEAANLGFIPLALEAASALTAVFQDCGKASRANEVLRRAKAYADRISSTLPLSLIKSGRKLPILEKFTKACKISVDKDCVKM
jgi:tetratricopeptide (TPR) repeat protein